MFFYIAMVIADQSLINYRLGLEKCSSSWPKASLLTILNGLGAEVNWGLVSVTEVEEPEVSVRAAFMMVKAALNNAGSPGIFQNSLWPVRLFTAYFNKYHWLLRL